jgi:uncharacterized membrane protein
LSSTAAFAALTKVQDMKEDQQRTELPRARWSWLEAESATWVARDVIDDATRQRILESYQVQSAERRSLLALMLLGALMLGIGVLLLIGYNWQRVPVSGKVAITMTSVALAFVASAWSYARQHRAAGETLALIGVLLFGNAIWLIAQILHIRGSFSDAFMWWAIGALATAWLVRSRIIGAGAALLVLVWVLHVRPAAVVIRRDLGGDDSQRLCAGVAADARAGGAVGYRMGLLGSCSHPT